jgi:hypothetical protein
LERMMRRPKISCYALRWESARKAEGAGRQWRVRDLAAQFAAYIDG